MTSIKRRAFLRTAGAALAPMGALGPWHALGNESRKPPWKRAFMLGGLSKGSPRATFQLLKEAGFEGVELISPNELDLHDVLKARDATGLVIHGVSGARHWKDPLSDPDPEVVARGMEAIRREFLDCKAYGGTTVLVVPAVVNRKVSYRDAYKRSQENIRKLIPEAQAQGVKIAIEEVWNKFLLSPLEMAHYLDEFQTPWIRAYFDIGNVAIAGYPQDWIRTLGKRIAKLHVKDFSFKKRLAEFTPLLEGEIDWKAVHGALAEIGYQGTATVELSGGNGEYLKEVNHRFEKILSGDV